METSVYTNFQGKIRFLANVKYRKKRKKSASELKLIMNFLKSLQMLTYLMKLFYPL